MDEDPIANMGKCFWLYFEVIRTTEFLSVADQLMKDVILPNINN